MTTKRKRTNKEEEVKESKINEITVETTHFVDTSSVNSLNQNYVVCPPEVKVSFLTSFLRRNRNAKIVVITISCRSAKFYSELLTFMGTTVCTLHKSMSQDTRSKEFDKFKEAEKGILIMSILAYKRLRELPYSDVDWIIHFDPPDDVQQYVNRTRGLASTGSSLLILRPHEIKYIDYIRDFDVSISEVSVKDFKPNLSMNQIDKLVRGTCSLYQSATGAYHTIAKAYTHYPNKQIFDYNQLDLTKLANSVGLAVPPIVRMEKPEDVVPKPPKKKYKSRTRLVFKVSKAGKKIKRKEKINDE